MLLISLPLYVLAALAGWALVGSPMSFCSSFVQCNPFSKEVSSLPRAGDWDVSAVTMEQHLHVTVLSKLRDSPGPPQSLDLPRIHPEVSVLTLPCSAPLGHCGNVK